ESRSLAGVVQADCRELAVSLYPAGGFSSMTLNYEAVQEVTGRYYDADWVIFYIGDYDPAGVLIDKTIERDIQQHLDEYHRENSDTNIRLNFQRIGITEDQVRDYNLPTKPRKESDKRAKHITYTVEAEAMPAHIMREILRSRI